MRPRVPASAFLVAFVVLLAGVAPAAAQTTPVLNPRIVEFDPSPDHSALDTQGQPIVQRYQLLFYRLGEAQPAMTSDLGKPSLETDGKIRVDFSTRTSPWPPPNGDYQARVAAIGPTGAGQSDSSNPFSFSFQSCLFALSPSAATVGSSGGAGTAILTTMIGCTWNAASNASWATVSSASGAGSANIGYTVEKNKTSVVRTATITVAGQALVITQGAAAVPSQPKKPRVIVNDR